MLFDHVNNSTRYQTLNPDFRLAFGFLQNQDLDALSPGKYTLRADEVFALLSDEAGFGGRPQARLESHRRYIDIQVILRGTDVMGWQNRAACANITEPYAAERDVIFYGDQPLIWLDVPAQHFVIFYPEDTHAPLATAEKIRKIVFKIAV